MASRLLVVEDEPYIGLDLADLAVSLGYEVIGPATNSTSALAAASRRPPDLAIVDVNLTDGPTGPFVASHLATSFGTQVLMVTANPELVVAGLGGVEAVLRKPYDILQLAEILRQFSASRDAKGSLRLPGAAA